jgi:hypothetical protein
MLRQLEKSTLSGRLAVKVIGTGAPDTLTIRFEATERDVLLDELRTQRLVIIEAAKDAAGRPHAGEADTLARDHAQLLTVSRLLAELEDWNADRQDTREIAAPTCLLYQVVRGAATEAIHRLIDALERFHGAGGRCTPDQLRGAAATATACVETLVNVHHVDHHVVT